MDDQRPQTEDCVGKDTEISETKKPYMPPVYVDPIKPPGEDAPSQYLDKKVALMLVEGSGRWYRKRTLTKAVEIPSAFSVRTPHGVVEAAPGDFLAIDDERQIILLILDRWSDEPAESGIERLVVFGKQPCTAADQSCIAPLAAETIDRYQCMLDSDIEFT